MRVLLISDVYFPRVNGVSTSIATFRADLGAIGVETTLVAPQYEAEAADADDPQILRVPSGSVPRDPEDRLMHWRALQSVLQGVRSQNFSIVHIHTPLWRTTRARDLRVRRAFQWWRLITLTSKCTCTTTYRCCRACWANAWHAA